MGERVQAVESWIKGHEKICGDRYRLLMMVIGIGGTMLVSVAGWGLMQVHADQQTQIQMLQGLSGQIQNVKAPSVNVQMRPPP